MTQRKLPPKKTKISLRTNTERLASDNTSSYTKPYKYINPEDRPREPINEIVTQTFLDQLNLGKVYNGLEEVPKKYNTTVGKSINLGLEAVKTKTPFIGDLIANTLQTGVEIIDSNYKNGGVIEQNNIKMKKRSLKKVKYEDGGIAGPVQLGGMAANAILGAIPDKQMTDMNGNVIGSYETKGEAIGKGAVKGAAAGAMLGVPGMLVGAAIGGGLGYINQKKDARELEKTQQGINNNIMTKRRLGTANNSVNTIQTNNENMYPHGGVVTTDQPGAVAELELQEQMQLPDGTVMGVDGPSHESGGVEVNVPEGTRVFSDRLKLGKKTFAAHSKTINNKISKLDNRPESTAKKNTEMLFNKQLDNLFNAQEEMKIVKEQKRTFKKGGVIPAHNVTLMRKGGLVQYRGDKDPGIILQDESDLTGLGGSGRMGSSIEDLGEDFSSLVGGRGTNYKTSLGNTSGLSSYKNDRGFTMPSVSPQNMAFAATGLNNIIQNQQINSIKRPRVLSNVNFTAGDRPDRISYSNERAAIDSEATAAKQGIKLGSGSYSTQAGNLQKIRNAQLMGKGRSFQTETNANTGVNNSYKAQQAAAYNQGVQANAVIDQQNMENQYNFDLWKTGNKLKATGSMGDTVTNLFNNQTSFNNQKEYWNVMKKMYSGNIADDIGIKKNGGTIRSLKKKK
jgi:hypothetical protein